MRIPNSNPLGGDMDGMGDLDNAPMPPMGADPMGGDPMGGPDDMGGGSMDEDPMGGPDDMGGGPMDEDPMGGPDDMGNEPMSDDENDELMDIINNLSIEDKAAVTKYAKSMVDDSDDGGMPDDNGEMPMESRRNMKRIIDEVLNDVIDDREGTKRPETRMRKEYLGDNDDTWKTQWQN